jgi:hypothetical protein
MSHLTEGIILETNLSLMEEQVGSELRFKIEIDQTTKYSVYAKAIMPLSGLIKRFGITIHDEVYTVPDFRGKRCWIVLDPEGNRFSGFIDKD